MGDGAPGAPWARAVLDAVGGGLAGRNRPRKGRPRRKGLEITIRLDNGSLVAIIPEALADEAFKPGERVRVVSGGGASRVTHQECAVETEDRHY